MCKAAVGSWGEASCCKSGHWARHIYKQDGIWHLDKRGLGVPPPHYLTPLTAHSICNALPNTLRCKGENMTALESAFDVVVNGGGKFGFPSPLFCHWAVLRACNELHFTPPGPAKQGNASLLSIVVTNCIKGVFNLKFTVCIEESSKKTYVNMNKLANAAWEEG